jgi:hypothetical protein
MQELEKQASENKEKMPNIKLLKAWQVFELFIVMASFLFLFTIYAFSGSKGMGTALSVLWKVFFLKIIILIFFFKEKRWAVIFNIVQNTVIFLFFIFAFFFTIFEGEKGHLQATLTLTSTIIVLGIIYFLMAKKYFQYYRYLRDD